MQAALTLVALVLAAAEPATATETIKTRDAEIRAVLPKAGGELTPALRSKVETILTQAIDLEAMAKDTLGASWDKQPKAKQRAFLDAFREALRGALRGQVEEYRAAETQFRAEEPAGSDDRVRVPTTLTIHGEPTEVLYTLKKSGAAWRIVDITIDEVSTVENYRASFGRIVSKEGFDALINRLKKRTRTP